MAYADGYVIPIPKKSVKTYQKIAAKAGKVWKDHGALDYKECVGDDLSVKWGLPFPKAMKLKKNETVIFAWVVYKNKAHRNKVNAAVMKDPRINEAMNGQKMPFDTKRMVYGGFNVIVSY